MRILFVGESWDEQSGPWYSAGRSIVCGLRMLGHTVQVVDNKRNYLPWGGRTIWQYSRQLQRFGAERLNNMVINKLVIERATRFHPDFVVLMKCENLQERTVVHLKNDRRMTLINWMHDNPFHYANTSIELLRSLRHYDVFATYIRDIMPTLEMAGCHRVEYIPLYYDSLHLSPIGMITDNDRRRYTSDVVFVANWSLVREQTIQPLAGLDFAIWGAGWDNLSPDSPLRRCVRGRQIIAVEYARVVHCAKVVVNVVNTQNRAGTNLRVFETTGMGRLLVTNRSEEVAELFRDGAEIVSYVTPEELYDVVRYYLTHDAKREQIAVAGHHRAVRDHTLIQRLQYLVKIASQIQNNEIM